MSKRKNHGHANHKRDALKSGKKGKPKRATLVLVFEGRDAAGKGGDHQADYRESEPQVLPGPVAGKADR